MGDPAGRREATPQHDDLDTPNCSLCLVRMEAVDAPSGEPYWRCASCGQARLA